MKVEAQVQPHILDSVVLRWRVWKTRVTSMPRSPLVTDGRWEDDTARRN